MGRKRITWWTRKAGIRGDWRVLRYRVDARRDPKQRAVRDLVDRQFISDRQNHFGAAHMINLPNLSKFIDLAMEGDVRAASAA